MSLEHAPRRPQVQMPELPKIPLPKRVEGGWSIREWFKKHPRLRNAIAIASGVAVLGGVGVGVRSAVENRTEESNPSQTNITATVTTNEASGNGGTVPTTEGGIVVTETTTTTKAPETTTTTEALDKGETVLMETDQIKISKYEELSNLPEAASNILRELTTEAEIIDVIGIRIIDKEKKITGNSFYMVKTNNACCVCYKSGDSYDVDHYLIGARSGNPYLKSVIHCYSLEDDKFKLKSHLVIYELGEEFEAQPSENNENYQKRVVPYLEPIFFDEEKFNEVIEKTKLIRLIDPENSDLIIQISKKDEIQNAISALNPTYDATVIMPQEMEKLN